MTRPIWAAKVKGIDKMSKVIINDSEEQRHKVRIIALATITTSQNRNKRTKRHLVWRYVAARIKKSQNKSEEQSNMRLQ